MTTAEAIEELNGALERLNLNKYFSVKLVGVKMPYGEVEEKKDLNGLWLAIYEAIKALKARQRLEEVINDSKEFAISIPLAKWILRGEEE